MTRLTKAQEAERQEYIHTLRDELPPGSTLYTVLRHVSRSGMSRNIDVYLIDGGEPHWRSYRVASALGLPIAQDAVKVVGCGMDMGFHIVSNLSRVLYPNGFGCIGEGCPSNDHSNGDRDYREHVECPDETVRDAHDFYRETGRKCKHAACHWHRSGDYAIRQRWM
jgi:hypothetical protein